MVQITVWEHQDFLWPASDRDAALRLPGIVSTKNKELKRALRLSRDPISLRQGSGGLLLRFAGVAGILNLVGYEFEIIPKFSFRQSASWQSGFFHMLSIAEYGHISFERSRHMGRGALSFCDHIALARHVRSQVLRRRLERVVSLLPKPEHHYRLPVHAALPAQYSRYRAALEIGNLIAGGASAVLQDQGSSGYGFLFNTERTYEKFLERMLQRIARRHTDWSVTAQRTAALGHPEGAGSVLFTRPDNTLTIQEMVTALIDAKYKCDLAGHGPLRQPRSGDYYQMLASLIAHGCAQALLVVPSEGDLGGEPPLLTWTTASGETIWRVGLLRWDISDLSTKSALLAAQNALEAQLLAFLF